MKALITGISALKSSVSALENRGGYWCGRTSDNALNQRFVMLQSLFAKGSAFCVMETIE